MPVIPALTTFTSNTKAKAAEVNANFSGIRTTLNTYGLFADVDRTISAVYTFNAAPVFAAGISLTGGLSITGNSTIVGTLGGLTGLTVASGGAAITGNSTVTGTLSVTGALTFGSISVPAASVTAGSLGTGNFTVTGTLTATSSLTAASVTASAGTIRGTRVTSSGTGSHDFDLSAGNHFRRTLSGNSTLRLTSPQSNTGYMIEVVQDSTGGRTVTWSAGTGSIVWANGITPTATTTANRKDIYVFWWDGTNFHGQVYGQNYAATS